MSDVGESAPSSAFGATGKSGHESPPVLPDASVYPFSPVGTKTVLAAPPARETKSATQSSGRGAMFATLVTSETDLVGIVAYGLYKHNKRDFLEAFEKRHGRAPDDAEIRAYMMGEETPRRVATYRHLAENFLVAQEREAGAAGAAPDAAASAAVPVAASPPGTLSQVLGRRMARRRRGGPRWVTAAYIAFLVLLLAGMAVLIRNGVSPFGGGVR